MAERRRSAGANNLQRAAACFHDDCGERAPVVERIMRERLSRGNYWIIYGHFTSFPHIIGAVVLSSDFKF